MLSLQYHKSYLEVFSKSVDEIVIKWQSRVFKLAINYFIRQLNRRKIKKLNKK